MKTAIAGGDLQAIQRLLNEGVDINERVGKDTLLHVAFFENQPHAARFLLDHGASIEIAEAGKGELFAFAVEHESMALADLLKEHAYPFDRPFKGYDLVAVALMKPALTRWWMSQGFSPVTGRGHTDDDAFPITGYDDFQDDFPEDEPEVPVPPELANDGNPYQALRLPEWAEDWTDEAIKNLETDEALFLAMSGYLHQHAPEMMQGEAWSRRMGWLWRGAFSKPGMSGETLPNREKLHTLLENGWVPEPHIYFGRGYHAFFEEYIQPMKLSFFWHFLGNEDIPCMKALLASAEIRKDVAADFSLHGSLLAKLFPLSADLLEFLHENAPLPVLGVIDPETQGTLLHRRYRHVTRGLLEKLVKIEPDYLWMVDHEGHTIFDLLGHKGPKWEAELAAVRLKRSLPPASRKKADKVTQPAKKRL
jgi:hypothetical protein